MAGFILKRFLEACESRGLLKVFNSSSSLENEVEINYRITIIRPLLVTYLFQINLPPWFRLQAVTVAGEPATVTACESTSVLLTSSIKSLLLMSAIIWGQGPFFAEIVLFFHVPCAPKSHCEKKLKIKKLNYFYVQTPSFCEFSSVKKTGYDVIKINNGIMSNEDLDPSLIGVELDSHLKQVCN